MEAVEIRTKSNGWVVQLDHDTHREYVFKATEIKELIEFVGRHVHGRRVKVELQ